MDASIIIFEDNERMRETLVYLLNSTTDYKVIGDFGQCTDAATIIRVYKPDVVLMDIDMPLLNGIEGVKIVKQTRPQTAVIMYTVFEDDERLFQCLCAGANGYLLKKTPPGKMVDAIEEVLQGGAPMSPMIAAKVLNTFHTKNTNNSYKITSREKEVLQLLTKGFSVKMIASELIISFDTARTHLKNIYSKLHVACGKEAIAKAINERIVN